MRRPVYWRIALTNFLSTESLKNHWQSEKIQRQYKLTNKGKALLPELVELIANESYGSPIR